MVKKLTKAEKLAEKRVERAFYASCSGIQIDVMDMGKVFDHGRKVLLANPGFTAGQLETSVRDFVNTIRKN